MKAQFKEGESRSLLADYLVIPEWYLDLVHSVHLIIPVAVLVADNPWATAACALLISTEETIRTFILTNGSGQMFMQNLPRAGLPSY
ncbi:hypothetical protein GCM10028803_61900 [Larkinella knui]|uniref:Uncharacterized protein n=1 Tax=Larkinella knui TaxID=2025310 RepID=A0A3P1CBA9_9BACT|nr:hypothetical protein [Larkinella knui]RRB10520.1 hypothetical protein EHT87_30345 [Larkinella knui]